MDHGVFLPSILLKLLIGLAVENPQLGLASITHEQDLKFGTLPYHFTTVSDHYVSLALKHILSQYKDKRFNVFGANFSRALRGAVGPSQYRIEPVSLSGYNIDFEVILDSRNRPIPIPFSWKHVLVTNMLKSVGIETCQAKNTFPTDISKMSALLDELSHTNSSAGENSQSSSVSVGGQIVKGHGVHLASDWGRYFVRPQDMPPMARRVAFELNGPVHYAVNHPGHEVGKDVVKRRQLEALGWQVITVSGLVERV